MKIGYIGLGKMGLNMVLRMKEKGHEVIAYNRGLEGRMHAKEAGVLALDNMEELMFALKVPRTIWIMVSHKAVDEVIGSILPFLEKGDTIIDGGNSFYKDSVRRAKEITKKGLNFLDIGVSGGPGGARKGACLMVGGEVADFEKYKKLFEDLSEPNAYSHMGKHGAGHFVKMVHNGIEYGMMQALAEGFSILKESSFNLNLKEVSRLYNHGSVVESRLVGWLHDGFEKFGEGLNDVSGTVAHSGEGEWTVKTGKKLGVYVPVIAKSFKFRVDSAKEPSYTGKILSAIRNQFGGHDIK